MYCSTLERVCQEQFEKKQKNQPDNRLMVRLGLRGGVPDAIDQRFFLLMNMTIATAATPIKATGRTINKEGFFIVARGTCMP